MLRTDVRSGTSRDYQATEKLRADLPSRRVRWELIVAFGCVAFLAFVVGSFAMYSGLEPAVSLRQAFDGGAALIDRMFSYNDRYETDFWKPQPNDSRGVTRYDAVRAQGGLTLYSSGHDQRALLIDMDGRVVHEWAKPYSELWDETAAAQSPVEDPFIYIEKTRVLPNGDLLALYTAIGDTPFGYGLVKLDKDSNVVWKYLEPAHHDFDIAADGSIVVLTQAISDQELPGFDWMNSPRVDDFIVRLSPDGRELQKLWLTGAFAASPLGRKLWFVPWHVHSGIGDYLHSNSVQVLTRSIAGVPQSSAGQVLVSLREVSTIALFDLESGNLVWAISGSWVRQHDAELLPDGNILLFDNEGDPGGTGVSRVLQFDPATSEVTWSYAGTAEEPLESVARGSEQRLPNGNTLIVVSYDGRMIEVTPEGDIVWEFVNPVRGGEADDRIPIIHWAERIDPKRQLDASFRGSLDLD